jgi:hypothetical protein
VGGDSTISEFQGNKLLEGATNLDARDSNFKHASGDQSIADHRVNANTIVVIENVTIVTENAAERMSSREHRDRERRRREHQENDMENVSIYEMIVCGTIVISCMAAMHALRVVLR